MLCVCVVRVKHACISVAIKRAKDMGLGYIYACVCVCVCMCACVCMSVCIVCVCVFFQCSHACFHRSIHSVAKDIAAAKAVLDRITQERSVTDALRTALTHAGRLVQGKKVYIYMCVCLRWTYVCVCVCVCAPRVIVHSKK